MSTETFKEDENKKQKEKMEYSSIDKEKQKNEIRNKIKKIVEQIGRELQGGAIDISKLLQDLDSLQNIENLKDLKEKIEKILKKLDDEKLKIVEDLFKKLEDLLAGSADDALKKMDSIML